MSPRKPRFDDPWGYCSLCNRLVPIDGEGQLTHHRAHADHINARGTCEGSLTEPDPLPESPEVAEVAFPDWKTAKNMVIPPGGRNGRRPRDPDYPVCDSFGHPLKEVAERLNKESEELRRKLERARRIHNGERG